MKVIKEQIRELANGKGWLNAKTGRTYKTAIGARDALKRAVKDMPKPVMQVIEWHTQSKTGSLIVKAITNA